MCKPMSGVHTRRKVFWSEHTDSHHEIISEHGLKETDARGDINVLPFEIVPPDDDYSAPMSKWVYRLDMAGISREIPSWYDAEKHEAAARAALKEWAKSNMVRNAKELTLIRADEYKAVVLGKATQNKGTILYNYGTVTKNYGTVTKNYGNVTYNDGTVTKNYGTMTHYQKKSGVETNKASGVIIDRSGSVPKVTIGAGA